MNSETHPLSPVFVENQLKQPLIALLEPNQDRRKQLSKWLQANKVGFFEAADWSKMSSWLEANTPNLVLCDLHIQDDEGQNIVHLWRKLCPNVAVVALSDESSVEDAVDAMHHRAIDYLSYPFKKSDLERAISRGLEHSRLLSERRLYQDKLEQANRELQKHLAELELDQKAGRSVQMSMLPPSPMTIGSFRLSHQIIPSLFLSGDFVDYFQIDDNYLAFYVADVSGHGVGSAFVTVLLKNFSRRFRREHGRYMLNNPAEALLWLNARLLEYDLGRHVTFFFGVIDISLRKLRYANAGQFPSPILGSAEGCQKLELPGPPLGLFESPEYDFGHLDLPDSFTLTLFTDGILDIMQGDLITEKEKKLAAAVARLPSDIEEIWRFLGIAANPADLAGEFPDDVCCLLISDAVLSSAPPEDHGYR